MPQITIEIVWHNITEGFKPFYVLWLVSELSSYTICCEIRTHLILVIKDHLSLSVSLAF